MQVKRCNIWKSVLLTIVTIGFYGLYWIYQIMNDIKILEGSRDSKVTELLLYIFIPFYDWYWLYSRGNKIETITKGCKRPMEPVGIPCLILGILNLRVVSFALIQNELNYFVDNNVPMSAKKC